MYDEYGTWHSWRYKRLECLWQQVVAAVPGEDRAAIFRLLAVVGDGAIKSGCRDPRFVSVKMAAKARAAKDRAQRFDVRFLGARLLPFTDAEIQHLMALELAYIRLDVAGDGVPCPEPGVRYASGPGHPPSDDAAHELAARWGFRCRRL